MKTFGLFLGCVAALALVGCGSDSGRRGGGGGDDAGGIVLMDSGTMMGTDAGTMTGTDSGTTSDCPPVTTSPPAGNVCAASTLECLMGATTADAQQACIDADPNPDMCLGCLNEEVIACATMNGCDDETGNFQCCIDDNGCTDQACVDANCGTETTAFTDCVNGTVSGGTCGISNLCFMGG